MYDILEAAERGVEMSKQAVMDMSDPLVKQVGGWDILDDLACQSLDKLENAAPVIKQPTSQVYNSLLFYCG